MQVKVCARVQGPRNGDKSSCESQKVVELHAGVEGS